MRSLQPVFGADRSPLFVTLVPGWGVRRAGSGVADAVKAGLIASLACVLLATLSHCRGRRIALTEQDQGYTLTTPDGRERSYILHRPYQPGTTVDPTNPRPLLIALHGGGGDSRSMINLTGGRFNELADARNFYVVYPQGYENGWNDGRNDPYAPARKENIDDLAFLSRLIDAIAAEVPIDLSRVFATGMSNGGFMSMRVACQMSDRIRAVAAVTAQLSADLLSACQPTRPVGVLIINGTEDPVVPYGGGEVRIFHQRRGGILSTEDTLCFWAKHNRCRGSVNISELPDLDPKDETRVQLHRYANCASGRDARLYTVVGGGHTWPMGLPYLGERLVGTVSQDLDATQEIWRFFESH